nr:DUF2142 domain-containing protein [Lachnoclostridium phocaeense]
MKELSIQKIFIYIAAIFGIVFVVLTPPFQSPDEGNHFKKAYVMSEGHFFPQVVEGKEGFYLSESIEAYISEQEKNVGKTDAKYTYTEILNEEKSARVYTDEVFTQFTAMSTNPVGHIIPMMGIIMGKIVAAIAGREPSIVMLLYFARMFCMIFYIACVAMAIKMTPILKRTFCILGLMPMSLFISSSVSYDGVLISVAFIFASLCFRLLFVESVYLSKYYIVSFGVIAFVFYTLKVVYLPLFLLLLFVPKEKYKDGRIIKRWLGIFAVFIVLILLFRIPTLFREEISVVSNTATNEQLIYVLENPLRYLQIWYETVKEGRDFFVSSTVGVFGLVDTYLLSVMIYPYVFVLIVTGILEISGNNVKVKWYQRISVLASIFISVFGIFLAMYLLWTPLVEGGGVGANRINGVQGRYFIPLLPVSFLCFGNSILMRNKVIARLGEIVVNNSILVSVIMLIVSQLTMLLRFWI